MLSPQTDAAIREFSPLGPWRPIGFTSSLSSTVKPTELSSTEGLLPGLSESLCDALEVLLASEPGVEPPGGATEGGASGVLPDSGAPWPEAGTSGAGAACR